MLERAPDYIGGWNLGRINQLYHPEVSAGIFNKRNFFHMFLESWHNPIEREEKEEIKGKIIDFYGESDVQGFLRDGYMHFIKRYGIEAIKKGSSRYPLVYQGTSRSIVLAKRGIVEIVMGLITCPESNEFTATTFLMRRS